MEAVYGQVVADWVNARMPFPVDFGKYAAIGYSRAGVIICGAIFNDYHNHVHADSVQVTFATSGPGSLTRGALRAMFWYAFGTTRIIRLEALTAKDNRPARKLLEDLGFTREGSHRRKWDGRQAAISYSMLRDECRWIDELKVTAKRAA